MRNRATTPLKKVKFRQSWSKYNLYNLSRIIPPSYRGKNFFQMKWKAKSELRQYHGEQVREGQWIRMFTRRFKGVVPMDPKYLAANDGTVESAGRGSGLKLPQKRQADKFKKQDESIPYMAMTFAPLERRLDTAVFRALFASSARQARQFVVHGGVKVNGKKMIYPGYMLNPGDMFQVDPDRVMYATGRPKTEGAAQVEKQETKSDEEDAPAEDKESETESKEAEEEEGWEDTDDPRQALKSLLTQSKELLSTAPSRVPGKRKQDVRAFQKSLKRTLSKSKSTSVLTDSLEAQFLELKRLLDIPDELPEEAPKKQKDAEDKVDEVNKDSAASSDLSTVPATESKSPVIDVKSLTNADVAALQRAMAILRDNPIDPLKPYATPWEPREYMSAFAFIPRYLEVNQNICAAVYLRHPVARPGLAEVPSPHSETTQGEAFAWYLRRR